MKTYNSPDGHTIDLKGTYAVVKDSKGGVRYGFDILEPRPPYVGKYHYITAKHLYEQ